MLMSKPGSQSGLYTKPADRLMERSGVRFALPPMVVLICPFGWLVAVPQNPGCSGATGVTQGSVRVGKLSLFPRKNSLMLGMRKPWDQEARSNRESVACQRKAARPEVLEAECWTPEPALPGLPPAHLNCDQRLAMSRLTLFMNGASATSGKLNSMYSALVDSLPLVDWVTLPLVLPSCTSASGCWKPSFSSDSAPRATPTGPAGRLNRLPVILAV